MRIALVNPRAEIAAFGPDATAITTAPSYLFWRCAPPELRVPMRTLAAIRAVAGRTIAIGPHAQFDAFGDIQEARPLPLRDLEDLRG